MCISADYLVIPLQMGNRCTVPNSIFEQFKVSVFRRHQPCACSPQGCGSIAISNWICNFRRKFPKKWQECNRLLKCIFLTKQGINMDLYAITAYLIGKVCDKNTYQCSAQGLQCLFLNTALYIPMQVGYIEFFISVGVSHTVFSFSYKLYFIV